MFKQDKINLVNEFKQDIESMPIILLVGHKKLKFSAIDKARRFAQGDTKIKLIKNRLAKIAFNGGPYEVLNKDFSKEKLVIMSKDLFDACKTAKFLADNNKDQINIIACASKKEEYTLQQITEIAKITSVQDLQARLLRAIKATGEKLLRVISLRHKN